MRLEDVEHQLRQLQKQPTWCMSDCLPRRYHRQPSTASTSMSQHAKRLQAAIQAVRSGELRLCAAARLHSVPTSTLSDNLKTASRLSRKPRGRPPCLQADEEQLIANEILEFADRGFPLQKNYIRDMIRLFVARLPWSRRETIPFKDNRPGRDLIKSFLRRHPEIRMRRRAALELRRKIAMSPQNMAMHFSRLEQGYEKYNITSSEQVFNLDESGVSSRKGGRGKGKAAMRASGRSNAVDLESETNAEHLTIMPVVSADGERWGPVVSMPGVQQKYRKNADGKEEFLLRSSDYLPKDTLLVHRTPASMTKEFFVQWVESFIAQTEQRRKKHDFLILTMDGFGAHLSYRALALLAQHNIIAYALPAHTSHRTQVLDYSVFSPLKELLRTQWSMRLIGTQGMRTNDCFTLCEMVHNAYRAAVSQTNIINGFHACELWSLKGGGVDNSVIKESDLTNRAEGETGADCYKRYQDKDFMSTRDVLQSDGPNLVNGHLNSVSGTLCDRSDLLAALKQQEEDREAERQEREQRVVEREVRRVQREEQARLEEQRRAEAQREREARLEQRTALAARKAAEKAEKARVRELNRVWDMQVWQRWVNLADSRSARRAAARLRFGDRD